ncbi:MAG: hypothetical protein ABWY50_02640, partial [Aeromicrobium sp.]
GAIHETLLHEQVGNEQRATVLSLGSMVLHPGASIGLVVLGAVATAASTGAAIVVGGLVLALSAPLFLVRAPAPAAARGAPMLDREGAPVAPTRLQEASPWANSYDSRSTTESGRSDSTGPR